MRIYWLNQNLCFHPEDEAERIGLQGLGDAFAATFPGIKTGHAEEVASGKGESRGE